MARGGGEIKEGNVFAQQIERGGAKQKTKHFQAACFDLNRGGTPLGNEI